MYDKVEVVEYILHFVFFMLRFSFCVKIVLITTLVPCVPFTGLLRPQWTTVLT